MLLLVAAGTVLDGQVSLRQQVNINIAAAKDAELIARWVPLDELTEERAAQIEAAAGRQVDRAKARLEQARVLVDEGLAARQSLAAPNEELASAQTDYAVLVARTKLVRQLAEIVESEAMIGVPLEGPAEALVRPVMEHFEGTARVNQESVHHIKIAFEQQFHEALPVSAEGDTAIHRSMGFDHRNRVDVALVPDTPEGVWLRRYLELNAIPYYAFRSRVPGKATGAHIHIGPASNRIIVPGRG